MPYSSRPYYVETIDASWDLPTLQNHLTGIANGRGKLVDLFASVGRPDPNFPNGIPLNIAVFQRLSPAAAAPTVVVLPHGAAYAGPSVPAWGGDNLRNIWQQNTYTSVDIYQL